MRDAARKAIDSTTLNETAAKAKLESKALRRFLQNGNPSPPTQAKLLDWYLGTRWVEAENTARCALGVLLAHTAPGAVRRTARELLDIIGRAPGGRPPWLRDLLAEVAATETDADTSRAVLEALTGRMGSRARGRDGSVPVTVLRSAVSEAVQARSARRVAAEIGMSHRGVSYFLEGGKPYPRIYQKLLAWYIKHGRAVHGRVTGDIAQAAMDALVEVVPASARERARRELVAVLASVAAAESEVAEAVAGGRGLR